MSTEAPGFPDEDSTTIDPLASLPTISGREARLAQAIRSASWQGPITQGLGWLSEFLGYAIEVGEVGYLDTLSGLKRPGVIAQVRSPAHQVTLGLHLETTLAHALVDRLLGYDRADGEQRLQVTPVEWGILTYALARCLNEIEGPSALSDLILERVGPESFRPEASLSYLTLLWPVRLGEVRSEVRAWVTESFLLAAARKTGSINSSQRDFTRLSFLASRWCAIGGLATLPRGLSMLRVGAVIPIDGFPLTGTVASPAGPVMLVLRSQTDRHQIPCRPAPQSGGGRLIVDGPISWEPTPREPYAVSEPKAAADRNEPKLMSADLPVTLTVELGRINLPLSRLADLKTGDLLELGRHSREPVELTSNGRLVARGELVQIDTELAVRITNVLL